MEEERKPHLFAKLSKAVEPLATYGATPAVTR